MNLTGIQAKANRMNKDLVILYFPETLENPTMISPPLSLMALGGVLEQEGFDVVIYDQRVDKNAHEKVVSGLERAIAVGISSLTGPQITDGSDLSKKIKGQNRAVPVVWGGWHPSLLPYQTIREPFVDVVVQGQGEITFVELLNAFRHNESYGHVRGIFYKKGGRIIETGKREIVDINQFPFLAYHLIDISKYPGRPYRPHGVQTTMRTQQGCPYRCEFCADPIVYKRKMVRYTPERIVDEIENLVKNYGVNEISFQDPIFILSVNHLKKFCEELLRRKLNILWSGTSRYTTIARMNEGMLALLKKSGCHMLHPGVEAGSQEMMDKIKKDQKLDRLMVCVNKLAKHKIIGLYSFIVGMPGEGDGEISKVFQLVKQIKQIDREAIVPVNFYTPYPVSPLYRKAIEQGFKEPDSLAAWKDFSARKNKMPWVTQQMEDEVMKKDKYYLPAAFPSKIMNRKMREGWAKWLYRAFHAIAGFRVRRNWYAFDVDWKLLLLYWKFWEKYHRKLPLHNIHFRW